MSYIGAKNLNTIGLVKLAEDSIFLKKVHGCHVLCCFVEFYSNPDTQCTVYLPYIYHKQIDHSCRQIYHTLSVWVKVVVVSSWILLALKK